MKIMLAVQVVGQLSFEPMLRRASVSAFLLTLITISGGRNYCINYFYIILGAFTTNFVWDFKFCPPK